MIGDTVLESLGIIAISLLVVSIMIFGFLFVFYSMIRSLDKSAGVDITDAEIWSNSSSFLLWLTGQSDAAKKKAKDSK